MRVSGLSVARNAFKGLILVALMTLSLIVWHSITYGTRFDYVCGVIFMTKDAVLRHIFFGLFMSGKCIWIFLESNGVGVSEAALSFHYPIPQEIVRQVAVVAGRGILVAALHPTLIDLIHHVAVFTGRGIGAEV